MRKFFEVNGGNVDGFYNTWCAQFRDNANVIGGTLLRPTHISRFNAILSLIVNLVHKAYVKFILVMLKLETALVLIIHLQQPKYHLRLSFNIL